MPENYYFVHGVSMRNDRSDCSWSETYESLAPDKINRKMEQFLVTLEPVSKKGMPYSHDGEKFLFVLEGRIEIQLGDHTDILEPGDGIYYDSTINHRVACAGEAPARISAVIYA